MIILPHSSWFDKGESLPFTFKTRVGGAAWFLEGPSSVLEVIGRSGHPKLKLAWIYDAGNKVVTGVGLSLVPYAEGKRRIMLEVLVGKPILEQRCQPDGATAFHQL